MQSTSIAALGPPDRARSGTGANSSPDFSRNLILAAIWLLPLIAAIPGLLILAAALAAIPWWRRERPERLPVGNLWIPVMGATAVSTALSLRPGASIPGLALCAAYLLTIWIVARAFDVPERVDAALRALFWSTVPWAVFGIALVAFHVHWKADWGPLHVDLGTWDNRANSVFWHPNILSGYLIFAMAAGLATAHGRWLLYGPALAALFVCQVLTQSRSGWVGTAVLAFTYLGLGFVADLARRGGKASNRSGLRAGLALFAVAGATPFVWPRLQTLFDPTFGSNLNRIRVWDSARDMIAERPLFGWGPGTWSQAYPAFRDPAEFENLPHAHSLFLHLGAEYGLLMLTLLLVLIGSATWHALRVTSSNPPARRLACSLASAIVGYLAMGLFEFTFSEGRNAIAFFVAVGLLTALGTRRPGPGREPEEAIS